MAGKALMIERRKVGKNRELAHLGNGTALNRKIAPMAHSSMFAAYDPKVCPKCSRRRAASR
jgi:hypothetical protein